MAESRQDKLYRLQLEREREIERVRDMRFIRTLLKEVVETHECGGFCYPISPLTIPFCPPLRITPTVKFGLPDGLDTYSLEGMYTKVVFWEKESAIYFNMDALYKTPRCIEDFRERIEDDKDFSKKLGLVGELLLTFTDAPTTREELASLISRELGKYLLFVRLAKEKQSWLHAADTISAPDLAAQIIKNGIIRYFERLYVPPSSTVADYVWERDSGDMMLSKQHSSLRSWYIDTCGVDIVSPALTLKGDVALQYIIEHRLDIMPDYQLLRIPQYGKDVLHALMNAH
ncbi:hypothetical protein IPH92_04530 [Candidatus Kaiserbacteria bacterium]|nr:MAG: hypothetical protein IPH92_04530 [Candidatus Kaiserbacteria bacterium]